jgi:transposase InsO family protein
MGQIIQESAYYERKQIQKYLFLFSEYEKVKEQKHAIFRTAKQFYRTHGIHKQTFFKYYHRFQENSEIYKLLPQKRGAKYRTRRTELFIENEVVNLRNLGNNRYEIANILQSKFKGFAPCPSTVYNIFKRYGLNNLTPKIKQERRRIIKMKSGELGHLDCYYLNKINFLQPDNKKYYLVGLIDDCTRISICEIVEDLKAITVMFATLRIINLFTQLFNIKFKEMMTDNGAEFGSKNTVNKENHPTERLFKELGIKHINTKPYRPQTNGKIERFWKTLYCDLIEDTDFDNIQDFQKELEEYICYYNYERSHQSLSGLSPVNYSKTVEIIS